MGYPLGQTLEIIFQRTSELFGLKDVSRNSDQNIKNDL